MIANESDLLKLLTSIGVKTFIFYYPLLLIKPDISNEDMAIFDPDSHAWTEQAIRIKGNAARVIFDNHLEKQALELIVTSEAILSSNAIRRRAQMMLNLV